jgi:hypothetical protein
MNRYAKRLTRLAARYRDAEEAVVRAYFARRPGKKDHIRWLKAQGFKEYSAIKPLLTALRALYAEVGRGVSRDDFAELTDKLADETKHARLVMDLLEQVTGARISPRDLTWLSEDRKLARVRAKYSKSLAQLLHGSGKVLSKEIRRKDEALERAAITLTEGGGGALYRVCSELSNRGFDGKIAGVFRQILADEVGHKDSGARVLTRLIKDEKTYLRAAEIIAEVCGQRLRMRNEQFGFPFASNELSAMVSRISRSATSQ